MPISQMTTLDKSDLGEYVGTLTKARVREILRGLAVVTDTDEDAR